MAFPTFKCEVAFGNKPGDTSLTWTDVSSYLRKVKFSRGRQYELNAMDPGSAQVTLKNLDRRFDPLYTSGAYYPNVVPMVPIRISATLASTTYRLFTGYVERWPQNRTGPTYAETQISCVDGFELLTQATLPAATYPQEASGSRIGRALTAAGWSSTARSLAAGQSQIPSITIASDDGLAALQHIQDVEAAETGWFFIDGSGNAVFLDRHTVLMSPYTTSQGTFTDQSAVDTSAVGYASITASLDKDLVNNDWRGTRDGGSTQIAQDSTSISNFFRRTQVLTPQLTTDSEVLAQMQYKLSQYKNPTLRFADVTITPGNSTAAWTQVLDRELGDRITLRAHPPGGGTAIVKDVHVQQIDFTVEIHAGQGRMVWQVLPADLTSYLILDDPINGLLDSNRLAY